MTSERSSNITEYDSESELIQDYKKIMSNSVNFAFGVEYFFDDLVDSCILEIVFRAHFESKHPDVFGNSDTHEETKKGSSLNEYAGGTKLFNCKCLNCQKVVSTNKFASHLENCMGYGRNSSRIASRKKTTNNSYYDSANDSDNDANWNEDKRKTKKKNGNSRSNNGKSNKKNYAM